ncbi:Os01g0846450 [Oryza sativa Japonica Group]|uniref:Os01g0846450 protein n=2 Tax=Oryza TaxID=4527 RepID=C7IX03_ORYSJ|nr:Os01g0846450 [Oryza sativa Japonica Group]|eukprot:NP_001172651.1 Os01g0846450 [Oryza sativa Japonica Group]
MVLLVRLEMTVYDEEHLDEVCSENLAKFQSKNKERRNESSLCHLLATFFHKFSSIGTLSGDVISTYTGQFKRIEENPSWMARSYSLFHQDNTRIILDNARPETTITKCYMLQRPRQRPETTITNCYMLQQPRQRPETIITNRYMLQQPRQKDHTGISSRDNTHLAVKQIGTL